MREEKNKTSNLICEYNIAVQLKSSKNE